MSWLELLLKSTEENEAPERYFWWSGLATISAVIRKNVWLDRHFYKLYPNIYVALISARSGLRKGIPISICKKILEEIDQIRIISGCNSIQGLIQELSQQKTLSSGRVIGEAHGIMLSDEFDSFLTDDPKSLTYLTALHNTHEHEKSWTKTLKGSPAQELKSPCLTMLIASNEVLFDSVVKRKDIEGGFIGRTFVVYERQPRGINSLVHAPKYRLDYKLLAKRLLEISQIGGEFKWSEVGGKLFEEWYSRLCKREDINDRTGSVDRLGDQVLKATMLISLARKDDLVIEAEDLLLAIEKCNECVNTAIRIKPTTISPNGDRPNMTRLVEKYLSEAPSYSITKSMLLSKLYPHGIRTKELMEQITQLIESGWVRAMRDRNNEVTFKLTDEGYRNLIGGGLSTYVH